MTTRPLQVTVLLLAVMPCAGPSLVARAGSSPPTKNILLIVTDDQRADTLWAMPKVKAWLQDHGVTFTNAFVNAPLCCPNRSSLFTGQYPRQHGVYSNHAPDGGAGKFDDTQTLATWLAPTYRTAYFGKYLNEFRAESFPYWPYLVPGWHDQRIFDRPPGSESDEGNYVNYGLLENGEHRLYGTGAANYSTNRLFQLAREFIASVPPERPFLAVVAPNAPHHPHTPQGSDKYAFEALPPHRPPSYNEPDVSDKPVWIRQIPLLSATRQASYDAQRKDYHETLIAVDRQVDQTLSFLHASGRLADTIVIFTSDNGYSWGEHRLAPGKSCAYEECIRVPLVIRTPQAGARVDRRLVQTADLTATILHYAGVTPTLPQAGRSLRPLLEGTPVNWRANLLIEFFATNQRVAGIVRKPFVLVHTGSEVYIQLLNDALEETNEREYYDLIVDPFQLVNRVTDPLAADRVTILAARLAQLRVE